MPGGSSNNRSGSAKEEDELISLIRSLIIGYSEVPLSVRDAFATTQALLAEHHSAPESSLLRKYCPSIGSVFVPLDLLTALDEYDAGTRITQRRFVAPTFREVREVLNLATVHSVASKLQLITLDADDTIYSDGGTLSLDSPMIPLICKFLRMGIHVALVTAAAYPSEPHKMEARIAGLLRSLAFAVECGAPHEIASRFHVMSGECNYLLRTCVDAGGNDGLAPRVYLEEVPGSEWKNGRGVRWDHAQVQVLLDTAEASLREASERLGLDVLIVRKARAVGIIARPSASATVTAAAVQPMPPPLAPRLSDSNPPSTSRVSTGTTDHHATNSHSSSASSHGSRNAADSAKQESSSRPSPLIVVHPYGGPTQRLSYEVLEEVALTVQKELSDRGFTIPHCAFNGGRDVFIDVGHKALGIRALQARVSTTSECTVHFGDRFTRTGNDLRARDVANTLWVTGPSETEYLLTLLLTNVREKRSNGFDTVTAKSTQLKPVTIDAVTTPTAVVSTHPLDNHVIKHIVPSTQTNTTEADGTITAHAIAPVQPSTVEIPRPIVATGDTATNAVNTAARMSPATEAALLRRPGQSSLVLPVVETPHGWQRSPLAADASLPSLTSAATNAFPPANVQQRLQERGNTINMLNNTFVLDGHTALPVQKDNNQHFTQPVPLHIALLHHNTASNIAWPSEASMQDMWMGGTTPKTASSPSLAAGVLLSHNALGSTRSHTNSPRSPSAWRGVSSIDDFAVPQVYGVTAAQSLRDHGVSADDTLRSEWQSAGGVIVGAVRPASTITTMQPSQPQQPEASNIDQLSSSIQRTTQSTD